MPDHDEHMQRVIEVQARYTEVLMKKQHVVGVAAGLRKREGQITSEICLVVMVDKKLDADDLDDEDRIPKELDGICIDVQEMGFFVAQPPPSETDYSDDDDNDEDDDNKRWDDDWDEWKDDD
jgi:hypothetical protein